MAGLILLISMKIIIFILDRRIKSCYFVLIMSVSKEILKRVIVENREFISKIPGQFIERDCFSLPEKTRKVVVLYGVRRSGKTYLLYQLMKENPDNSLYIDFEDERLIGFSVEDFEKLLPEALASMMLTLVFDVVQQWL